MESNLTRKFSAFLADLPDKELLKISNEAQKVEWHLFRKQNLVLSLCFRSRYCGENDPIIKWKKNKESLLEYKMYWIEVEMFDSLWGLVQLTFSDIQKALEDAYKREGISYVFPFAKAWDLFLEIVKVQKNSVFSNLLKQSHKPIDPKRDKRIAELSRKHSWTELTKEEEIEFKKLVEHCSRKFWKEIVYIACNELSKSDSLIASKYKYHQNTLATFNDLAIKMYSDSAKGRSSSKIKSQWWIDGERYVGQKRGGKYSPTNP